MSGVALPFSTAVAVPERTPPARRHVAIAWHGLPFHAARAIEELIAREPALQFTLLTTRADDEAGPPRFTEIAGVPVRLLHRRNNYTWAALGLPVPAVFIFTSWSHPAYLSLAKDAKRHPGARTVSMVDDIHRRRPGQWAGRLWYRTVIRRQIDRVWVPGLRARAFARMLGVPEDCIVDGLYGADPCIFAPTESGADELRRTGVLYVGPLTAPAGVPALLEAARRSADFGAGLTVVGEGPLAHDLVGAGVRRYPALRPGRLAPLFERHRLFVRPAALEPWSIELHEAALSGCLLATTRHCGAADDLIVHGCNGYIMDGASPEDVLAAAAWAEGLDRTAAREARQLSRERAAAFGPDRFCRAFARLTEVTA